MKKENKPTKPESPDEARRAEAEIFLPPPPPSKGIIVGLDCHPDTYTAATFKGTTVHNAQHLQTLGDMSLEGLLRWAEKTLSRNDLVLMEAGANSFELHRRLAALGIRSLVLESCHVGKHAKTYADNDAIAAKRIAMVFLGTKAPCVWVPDEQTCQRRELLHLYNRSVKQDTESTNALKGYLNQYSIRLGKLSIYSERTHDWIMEQRNWSDLQQNILADHFEQVRAARQRRKQALRHIAQEAANDAKILALMGLLGIGLVNAFALVATIGEISRFASPRKLAAYLGLNPGQRDSGTGKRIKTGVGKRGCKTMRYLLIQAAHAVLRSGRHTELGKWGWKLFARKGHRNVAVAAVARKLSAQVWHLLSGNTPDKLEPSKTRRQKLERTMVLIGKAQRAKLNYPPRLSLCVELLEERISKFKLFPQQT